MCTPCLCVCVLGGGTQAVWRVCELCVCGVLCVSVCGVCVWRVCARRVFVWCVQAVCGVVCCVCVSV